LIKPLTFYLRPVKLEDMGDMADWTLESAFDAFPDYESEPDDWENGVVFVRRWKNRPVCKYCGKKNLRWQKLGERWLLYDGKGPHRCPNQPLPLEILKALADEVKLAHKLKKINKNK
jgi:hypothetical protein